MASRDGRILPAGEGIEFAEIPESGLIGVAEVRISPSARSFLVAFDQREGRPDHRRAVLDAVASAHPAADVASAAAEIVFEGLTPERFALLFGDRFAEGKDGVARRLRELALDASAEAAAASCGAAWSRSAHGARLVVHGPRGRVTAEVAASQGAFEARVSCDGEVVWALRGAESERGAVRLATCAASWASLFASRPTGREAVLAVDPRISRVDASGPEPAIAAPLPPAEAFGVRLAEAVALLPASARPATGLRAFSLPSGEPVALKPFPGSAAVVRVRAGDLAFELERSGHVPAPSASSRPAPRPAPPRAPAADARRMAAAARSLAAERGDDSRAGGLSRRSEGRSPDAAPPPEIGGRP